MLRSIYSGLLKPERLQGFLAHALRMKSGDGNFIHKSMRLIDKTWLINTYMRRESQYG